MKEHLCGETTKKMKIVLASNSPRRRELLSGLGFEYEVRVMKGVDESYPDGLSMEEIPQYISRKKAAAYTLGEDELLITADTIVWLDGEVLGKPADEEDARRMLRKLSGRTHQVVTGVTLKIPLNLPLKGRLAEQDSLPLREGRGGSSFSFSSVSQVTFAQLTDAEIDHYVTKYRPLDKAGAYGIQEWIGFVGVTSIVGSYFNVMGLPVQRLYTEMKKLNLI
ncbi:MAG: septum formation protein Maf [Bacteroidaceae bacterium]|nr:septum formation protein Maf [Bacteroidaceae bacterium]